MDLYLDGVAAANLRDHQFPIEAIEDLEILGDMSSITLKKTGNHPGKER